MVVIAVAVAGALGVLARYGLDTLIERRSDSLFPWSTLAINVTGCFLIGLAVALLVDRWHAPTWLRLGATVGFLGGYTTFSTFAYETQNLLESRHLLLALANGIGSVVVGVAAVYAGLALGRL
jgi:CrcB protein